MIITEALKACLLKERKEKDTLLESIRSVAEELDVTRHRFDNEDDPVLLEAWIYRRKSLEALYSCLLRRAHREGLSAEPQWERRA